MQQHQLNYSHTLNSGRDRQRVKPRSHHRHQHHRQQQQQQYLEPPKSAPLPRKNYGNVAGCSVQDNGFVYLSREELRNNGSNNNNSSEVRYASRSSSFYDVRQQHHQQQLSQQQHLQQSSEGSSEYSELRTLVRRLEDRQRRDEDLYPDHGGSLARFYGKHSAVNSSNTALNGCSGKSPGVSRKKLYFDYVEKQTKNGNNNNSVVNGRSR